MAPRGSVREAISATISFKNTLGDEKVRIQMNCTYKGLGTEDHIFLDALVHFAHKSLFWKEVFYNGNKPPDDTTPFTRFALETSFKELMLEKFNVKPDESTHFLMKSISPERTLYLNSVNKNDVLMRSKNNTLGNLTTTIDFHSDQRDILITFKDYQQVVSSELFEVPKDSRQ